MPPLGDQKSDAVYWRSLDDLADAPSFRGRLEREFAEGTLSAISSATRRQFLKLAGASMALAGATGCRWPKENIVPFAGRPEDRNPGEAQRFATACELNGVGYGLLVTSYDGRPIKIEGNPLHPTNGGATDALTQAAILEMYDPHRSQSAVRREGGQTIRQTPGEFSRWAVDHFARFAQRRGEGLYVLAEASASPSVADMRARLTQAMPAMVWCEYEPLSRDNELEGSKLAFGDAYRTQLALDKADVIVCLDADLLMTHPAALRHARDFARGRRPEREAMNRLYVVEPAFSITGAAADHRLAVSTSDVWSIVRALLGELIQLGFDLPQLSPEMCESLLALSLASEQAGFVRTLAADLFANRGRSVVAAGARQPPVVHAVVHMLNAALGNVGHTVSYTVEPLPDRVTHVEAIRQLAQAARDGRVETLLILGGNPVFDAPADVAFASALAAAKTSIHLSLYDDETSGACTRHVPRAHWLESWGDVRAYDGTVSIAQPLIEPLYGGKTAGEMLALVLGEAAIKPFDIVRRTFGQKVGADPSAGAWRKALHDGVVADSAWDEVRPALRSDGWDALFGGVESQGQGGGIELVFCQDHSVYDGRFANNAWLQEMPDPMTKLTWDNAALIGPELANELKVATGDGVDLKLGSRRATLPAYVMPGQARGSVVVSLGYGRTCCGPVGDGVGYDVHALRTCDAMDVAHGLRITKASSGSTHPLACTQDHHAIGAVGERQKRKRQPVLVREATLTQYKRHNGRLEHGDHHPPLVSLWTEPSFDGHRWGMAIDLNACVGCGACVVACQAENNSPVVGKDQVINGREMHWLRVDRYFRGPPEQPAVALQPVPCMHCENAPCEQVCPVAATVHDEEGLNVMVYNRCVGTRYCSNNCPYKVRRFNFFNYRRDLTETEKMAMNPEVTVRSRGVMEKCTYCTQRIQLAKIKAKNERRPLRDGQIVPACAQTCPTGAIVFGDLGDPRSKVSKLRADGRAYAMLAELNVKPRTVYLAKLRNPHPKLVNEGDEHDGH